MEIKDSNQGVNTPEVKIEGQSEVKVEGNPEQKQEVKVETKVEDPTIKLRNEFLSKERSWLAEKNQLRAQVKEFENKLKELNSTKQESPAWVKKVQEAQDLADIIEELSSGLGKKSDDVVKAWWLKKQDPNQAALQELKRKQEAFEESIKKEKELTLKQQQEAEARSQFEKVNAENFEVVKNTLKNIENFETRFAFISSLEGYEKVLDYLYETETEDGFIDIVEAAEHIESLMEEEANHWEEVVEKLKQAKIKKGLTPKQAEKEAKEQVAEIKADSKAEDSTEVKKDSIYKRPDPVKATEVILNPTAQTREAIKNDEYVQMHPQDEKEDRRKKMIEMLQKK